MNTGWLIVLPLTILSTIAPLGQAQESADPERGLTRQEIPVAPAPSAQGQPPAQVDVHRFLNSPPVWRVTKLTGEVNPRTGRETIHVQRILQVTVTADGKVDLGQIVPGGPKMAVPAGSCAVGDLITVKAQQIIHLPADHFAPLGGLADTVNQPAPLAPAPPARSRLWLFRPGSFQRLRDTLGILAQMVQSSRADLQQALDAYQPPPTPLPAADRQPPEAAPGE